ncbi:MAG: isoprenylcysteine carboxylmethyltransferase family protein [Enterobacterales bacterium]|nr:isoprenylcysteine carboxylmethyltransferase family protein [Enterobacterales bacterium]
MNKLTRPQVKFPPPVFYLVMILLGYGVNFLFPLQWQAGFLSYWVGIAMVGFGLMLVAWSAIEFRRHKTTIMPHKASSRIIQAGPFKFSRNPIYTAFTIIQLGVGIALGNIWILLLAIPAVLIMTKYVIEREEAFLKQEFGEEYLAYLQSVRRWI